jgi:hypothetical protein
MKTFYSVEDIENFAAGGQREIYIDENIVLTDLAKQTAHMLGIRITEKPSRSSPGAFTPARPPSVGQMPALGGKPKGCQRGPAMKSTPAAGTTIGQSRPVVDKLVEKIKRINGQSG